jgi:EmrB/QacA subfamily drug resistance transporter
MALIVSRFFQAFGGAMIMANSPAIITEAFPPHERGKALGTIGTVVGIGIMVGSPLGGEIVSVLNWRYIFFINIPVGIIGTALSIIILKGRQNDVKNSEPFDFLGAFLLIIFLVTFLLGLNIGSRTGFGQSKVLVLFAISLIFFIIFLITEFKVRNPTVELHLFQNMGFSSTNLAALASYTTIFMVMFMLPFFLARVTELAPGIIGRIMIVFSPLFGWVSDKIGYRLLRCSGLTLMALALFFLSYINKTTQINTIVSTLFLFGFGVGMFTPANNSLLMGSVPKDKLGVGAGMLAATRNIGMMIGVAAASAIFTHQVKHYSAAQIIDPAAVIKSYMAYSDVFFVAAFVSISGIIVAFFQDKFIS